MRYYRMDPGKVPAVDRADTSLFLVHNNLVLADRKSKRGCCNKDCIHKEIGPRRWGQTAAAVAN